jgi:hypothetical protein
VRWETPVPWPPGFFGSITAMLGVTGPAPAPAALGRVQWGASGPRVEACLAAIRKPFSSWHRLDPYQPGQSAAIVTLPGGRQYVHLWAREYDWPGLPRDKASTVMGYLCAETPAGPQVIASGQFFSFDGVADLDGDGVYEVLARGRPADGGHLRLFDGTSLSDPKRLLE